MAYYLNAYNALAITGVIDRPGLGSVHDMPVRFFFFTRYQLGGDQLDLYRLENQVVRPLGDPRIHFALNCQSVGCPKLPREAFHPERVEAQLDAATREFVSNPDKVRVEGNTVKASQIFEWYLDDFEGDGGLEGFLLKYGIDVPADASIEWIEYDWSLIAQEGRGP
jgi:hypothetical protein